MRWLWSAVIVVGVAVIGLGLLWFLQGSDLVHIDPIACAGDCEPIRGHRPEWQIAGAVAAVAGAVVAAVGLRKVRGYGAGRDSRRRTE